MDHAGSNANHKPHAATYADATARLAATGFDRQPGGGIVPFDSTDVGKFARQSDNNSVWQLTDDSPVTWAEVGGNAIRPDGSVDFTANQSMGNNRLVEVDDPVDPGDAVNLSTAIALAAAAATSDEHIQDVVGALLTDSDDIDFNYDDDAGTTIGTLKTNGVTPGVYANPDSIEVDDTGRVVDISPGGTPASDISTDRPQLAWGLTAMYKNVNQASSDTWSTVGGMTLNYANTGAQTILNHADGYFGSWQSTGGLSNVGNKRDNSYSTTYRKWKPIYATRIRTDSAGNGITSSRIWIGVFSADPFGSATPTVHLIAFRFDTGAGDTNWQCVTDNGSGTPTVTDSAIAVAADTTYDLRFECSASDVKFYINDVLVATITTTLPTSTQAMGWQTGVKALTGVNRQIHSNHIVLIQPR
jgi:hypothetical protein